MSTPPQNTYDRLRDQDRKIAELEKRINSQTARLRAIEQASTDGTTAILQRLTLLESEKISMRSAILEMQKKKG